MGKPIQQTDFRWGPKPNNAHSQYKRLKQETRYLDAIRT